MTTTRTRILIVEDEALIAMQLAMQLGSSGFEVCGRVANAEAAIAAARRESPDLVLLDISLPGKMDGIEAAQGILAFSRPKIVFTTGQADPEIKARAMVLGPLAYLTKPVDLPRLLAVIAGAGA